MTARQQFGKQLRAIRTERGISQEELADLMDGHRNFLGRIERGEVNLTFDYLIRLSKALKVKPAVLLDTVS